MLFFFSSNTKDIEQHRDINVVHHCLRTKHKEKLQMSISHSLFIINIEHKKEKENDMDYKERSFEINIDV